MKINKLFLLLTFILILFNSIAYAEPFCEDIFFFHSKTCPHCIKEKAFLDELENKYPELNIQYVEVAENHELFELMSERYETIAVGVPRTFINGTVFVGFTEENGPMEYLEGYKGYSGYKNQIEKAILEHLAENQIINLTGNEMCFEDPIDEEQTNIFFLPLALLFLYGIFFIVFRKKIPKNYLIGVLSALILVIFFYISQKIPSTKIVSFAKQFSFPVFTFIMGLLDGFNPCAFAVLAILLSLLVYAQSKKKMALIGIIFILTSSFMYFLFIIILLTLRAELLGAYKGPIRIVVGMIALTAGAINIKDFFFFKKGLSLTISKEKMGKIMQKMRDIVNEVKEAKTKKSLFMAIIGTIILAAFVNLVELGCTLILPIQYIEVLITNYGTQVALPHYLYIAFYCVVYVIPLFVILGSFLYTFKSERMTETKGKLLKLISGLVMLGLGLILLFKPELMVFG